MTRLSWYSLLGIFLVVLGGLTLVQNFIFPGGSYLVTTMASGLFILVGLGFLYILQRNPRQWWAAIPGIILVFLGALIALERFVPGFSGRLSGSFFLAGISLSFWVVFLLARKQWWAIIPAGTLATLAIVAGVDRLGGFDAGGIFFIGLGITFALLTYLPYAEQRQSWAWIPAVALLVFGAAISIPGNTGNYIWPVGLILAGAFLILRPYLKAR